MGCLGRPSERRVFPDLTSHYFDDFALAGFGDGPRYHFISWCHLLYYWLVLEVFRSPGLFLFCVDISLLPSMFGTTGRCTG